MYEIYQDFIAITNRQLCEEDYLTRIRRIARVHPRAVILREKDLSPEAYASLAEQVLAICREEQVPCFLHTDPALARRLGCTRIHFPLAAIREMTREDLAPLTEISVSCHSVEDVRLAAAKGATQIVLGTIFETDCKKGLPGKGLAFLRECCGATTLPVFAIGGIQLSHRQALLEAGAAGGCMMSGFMKGALG